MSLPVSGAVPKQAAHNVVIQKRGTPWLVALFSTHPVPQHPKAPALPQCYQLARLPCPFLWACAGNKRGSFGTSEGCRGQSSAEGPSGLLGVPCESRGPHVGQGPCLQLVPRPARTGHLQDRTRLAKHGGVRWGHALPHGPITP